MNKYFKDMTENEQYAVETLSVMSLEGLMIDQRISMDNISLEDGLFGKVKELGGKISSFFSGLFRRIKTLLDISDAIAGFWSSGIDKEVIASIKTYKSFSKDLVYADIANIEIPVTLGLRTKALPLMEFLNKETSKFLKEYVAFMERFDTDLSEYISIEDFRIRFSSTGEDRDEKKLNAFNTDLMKLLNTKQVGAKATFDDLYGSRAALADSLTMSATIQESVKEKDFRNATKLIDAVKPKLDALYDLIEVEKEPVSKESLRSIINRIELASDYTTVLGKIGLLVYETSKQSVDTVAILKAIEDKKEK